MPPGHLSPRSLQLPLGAHGSFTVEIDVPECFTDRSNSGAAHRGGATHRGATHRSFGVATQRGSARTHGSACCASPGFTSNPSASSPKHVAVAASDVHMVGGTGTPLMPHGCCTPLGLVGLAEVVRVLLPGGASLAANAELQATFGVLRLVQALFFSAPLFYLQAWVVVSIGFKRVLEHHAILLVSAAFALLTLVLALTSFVISPASDRPCRVRGWLITSRAVSLACALYFTADATLRALAVSTLGYAAGAYALCFPALLILLWMYCSCGHAPHVWLEIALRHFAFSVAPPVLDGLGGQPQRLALEACLSTGLCAACVLAGLRPTMPHPQHDPLVVHALLVALSASATLKLATLAWCVFPALTAAYPVVGVSQLDCFSSRSEAQRMAQSTQEGTRRFIESRSR